MYDKKKYEGPFAWKPDRVETGIWGSTETHNRYFGPPVTVEKNIWGTVTKVNRSWL